CLPRFYAYPRIGIGGAIMGLVTGVLAALVARSGTLVLVVAPAFGTALYCIQFLLACSDPSLIVFCLISLGFSNWLFPVHRTDMANAAKVVFQIFLGDFELKGIHTGIGLDRSRINSLCVAADHPALYAQLQHFYKDGFKDRFREQLSG